MRPFYLNQHERINIPALAYVGVQANYLARYL